jgi:hypothetical protein
VCVCVLQASFFIFFIIILTKLCMDNPVIFISSRASNLKMLLAPLV